MPCRSGSPHDVLPAGPAFSASSALAGAPCPATGTGANFRSTTTASISAARPVSAKRRLFISDLLLLACLWERAVYSALSCTPDRIDVTKGACANGSQPRGPRASQRSVTVTVNEYGVNRLMSSAYAMSTYFPGLSNVAVVVAEPPSRLFTPAALVMGTDSGSNFTRPGPRHWNHDTRNNCLKGVLASTPRSNSLVGLGLPSSVTVIFKASGVP